MKQTKLNHLLPKHLQREYCPESDSGKQNHIFLLTGGIESSIGNNVSVGFYCARCQKRLWNIFFLDEFKKFEHLLTIEGYNK